MEDREIIELINIGALNIDEKGYYFLCPASIRRNGKYRISAVKILRLLTSEKINKAQIPSK